MNPALAVLAAITIAGAVLAVSSRDVRTCLLGILIVLLGAPLIADPWPTPLAAVARVAAALLAVRLLAIGLRGEETARGSRLGWPAEALLAAAAGVAGFGSHGLGAAAQGPAEAQAAGFGLLVLAAAPLASGRDVLRLSLGSLLLIVAATLIRSALDAPAGETEQLIGAVLTIGLGGAIGVIATAARGAGGLAAIGDLPPERARYRAPDAHPLTEAELRSGRMPADEPVDGDAVSAPPAATPSGPGRRRRPPPTQPSARPTRRPRP